MRQKLTEKLLQNIFAFSTNAITSKVFIIFLCNKRQWKSNKFFFLLIYSFIYFRQTLIPKCASIIQSVCIQSKGRHTGTNLIDPSETGRHVRIFPAGGDPAILPRKISFHGNIERDVLFAKKLVVGLQYRCKARHMLGQEFSCYHTHSKRFQDVFHSFTESTP